MSVFIDTSAFLAVLDADDSRHEKAKAAWHKLLDADESLVTSNYVLVETAALLQNRIGIEAVRLFQEDVVPVLILLWVDEAMHSAGMSALLAAKRRRLSFVDCTSFEAMRKSGATIAFTFDGHFKEQGFASIPR